MSHEELEFRSAESSLSAEDNFESAFQSSADDVVVDAKKRCCTSRTALVTYLMRRCPLPIFYGWVIVVLVSIGIFASSPGEDFGIIVFAPFVERELAVEQRFLDLLYLVSSLVAGVAAVPLGVLIERHDATLVTCAFIVVMIGACVLLAVASNAWVWATGFLIARLSGQSVLYGANIFIVSRWFKRRRGAALGWTGFVHQLLCVNGFPFIARSLASAVGWRVTEAIFAAFGVVVLLPLYWVFVFTDPSDIGLVPDGHRRSEEEAAVDNHTKCDIAQPLSRRQIVTNTWFWTYVVCSLLVAFFLSGVQIHLRATFAERGVDVGVDESVFLSLGLTTALLELAGGFGSDYLSRHWLLLVAAMAALLVTLVLGIFANAVGTAIGYGIAMGVAGGLTRIAINIAFPRLFGVRCLAFALGFVSMARTFGSSLGPVTIGAVVELYGSHSAALLRLLPLVLLGLLPQLFGYVRGRAFKS